MHMIPPRKTKVTHASGEVSLFYGTNLPVVLTPSVLLGAHIIAVDAPLSGDHGGPPCAARLVRYIR